MGIIINGNQIKVKTRNIPIYDMDKEGPPMTGSDKI